MDKDTVKDLTLILMYLTSWEERLVPDLHEKPDRTGFHPQIRRTWKGFDFGILNELTDEGVAKALELLKQYGITLERHGGEEAGIDGTK